MRLCTRTVLNDGQHVRWHHKLLRRRPTVLIKTNFAQVCAEVPPPALTEIAYQAGNHGASGDHRTGFQLSAVGSQRQGFDHAHPLMPVMVRILGQTRRR